MQPEEFILKNIITVLVSEGVPPEVARGGG
jgi:hypothetical protein